MAPNNTINKLLPIVIALLFSMTAFAQINKLAKVDLTKLPIDIKYEGKIKDALRWTDNFGDNIVITTETGIYQSKKFKHNYEGSDAELFAYHFILSNNIAKQTWKVYDFISDCPVDIETTFLKNSFQVTDLNEDGIAEIWLMYKKGCRGDISPIEMKIIMYQGQQKFAMRGQNKVQISENIFDGGGYKFDTAFEEGPAEFKAFAEDLWNKNILGAN
jgi:hypothetical protein